MWILKLLRHSEPLSVALYLLTRSLLGIVFRGIKRFAVGIGMSYTTLAAS